METYTFSSSFVLGDMRVHPVHIRAEQLRLLIPAHRHSKTSYELHYIAEGHGTVAVNGLLHEIGPGSVYMTGPELIHEQTSDSKDLILEYCLYLNCEACDGTLSFAPFRNGVFYLFGDDIGIGQLLTDILQEMRLGTQDSEEMGCALLRQLILRLNRYCGGAPVTHRNIKNVTSSVYPDIEDAFFYRYSTLRLEELASMLNLSPRQTQRFLQEHYGKSFTEKRIEAQMSAAAQLLSDLSLRITEVAEHVGFTSAEHFSVTFKRYFGQSPRAYRKGLSSKP